MRRIIPILLCCALLLTVLTGCGTEADMDTLRDAMTSASTLPEMLFADEKQEDAARCLGAITDIAYEKVDTFFMAYAADGTAYEIAVIRLRSAQDMPELEDSLKEHISRRTEQYRYYMPEQAVNAERAIVAANGAYAALIMCDDPAAVKAAFDNSFS